MSTSFNRVARAYRWLEYLSFGPWLARCRNAQLPHLAQARHALVLGDGDGRFLSRLLSANPKLTVDAVDSSQSMLSELDRRIYGLGPQAHGRIRTHHADALTCDLVGSFDLIVTHFFLDCFFPEELERLVDRILAHASPSAQWVISEFAIPEANFLRPFAQTLVAFLYQSFGLLTGLEVRALPDYQTTLRSRGLIMVQESKFLAGLLQSQLWVRRTAEANTLP